MSDEKYKAKLAKLNDRELIRHWYLLHEKYMRARQGSINEHRYFREKNLTAIALMDRGYIGEKTTIWKKVAK